MTDDIKALCDIWKCRRKAISGRNLIFDIENNAYHVDLCKGHKRLRDEKREGSS